MLNCKRGMDHRSKDERGDMAWLVKDIRWGSMKKKKYT